MTSPRTYLGRAAILLGCIVALASLTGAAPAQPGPVGPCEPDGTSVDNVPGFNRLQYELDQYARRNGYTVSLSRTESTHAVAGYVDALPTASGPRDLHACFYVPLSTPPLDVVPTIWRRTIDTMRQLDRVSLWTNK